MKPVIHVLTTEHRKDRHKSIVAQSESQGFDIKWFKGERGEEIKDVKKCICQGHKSIIQYAKENGLDDVLICEDDVRFFAIGSLDYFIENKPKSYDLYCGIVYQGEVKEQRIINGMSGTMTCYFVHNRFYDVILNDVAIDSHIDRSLGDLAHKYEYYVPPMYVCEQSGSYSDNLRRKMNYKPYLEGKPIYGKD